MAQRQVLSVRVDPVVRDIIKARATDLEGSDGYIIEWMAAQVFKSELPPGYRPGRRLTDEEGGEK